MSFTSAACTPTSGSRLRNRRGRRATISASWSCRRRSTPPRWRHSSRDCPVIDVPGTLHPLTLEYAPAQSMAQAIDQVLPRTRGNVLCFLPGVREIDDAIAGAAAVAIRHGVTLMPLHGSLPAQRAGCGAAACRIARRVIVATNIAETSLTVPGVSAVIDSGLHKVARYDADRAVDSLTTERITLDSADQRAGRAARLGPGLARRLWDARDRLRPHREADIHRVDLSSPVLAILAAAADLDTLRVVRSSGRRSPRVGDRSLDASWRGGGRPHHIASAGTCSACRCRPGWRASFSNPSVRSRAAPHARGWPNRRVSGSGVPPPRPIC